MFTPSLNRKYENETMDTYPFSKLINKVYKNCRAVGSTKRYISMKSKCISNLYVSA